MSDASERTKTQVAVSDFLALVASGEHIISKLPMETVDVEGAELVVDLPFDATLSGPRGHLQGGVTATLADMVGGRLAMKDLEPNQLVVTTDLTVHYLAGIKSGLARAIGATLRSSTSSGRSAWTSTTASTAHSPRRAPWRSES